MRTDTYCIISTTVPTQQVAQQLTQALLQRKLVACIQSTEVHSSYIWNNSVAQSQEILLQMKSSGALFEAVKTEIESHHPYDVPEIIMTPIIEANSAYLQWIKESIASAK